MIAKPLEWFESPLLKKTLEVCRAPTSIQFCEYRILLFGNEYRAVFYTMLTDDWRISWKKTGMSTLEEAKAVCDKHNEELVLSMLSPEATGLLLKHDF